MGIGIGAAILGGAVISGGAGLFAASKAGQAQTKAAEIASQTELQMYNQTRADLAPYRDVGGQGLGLLAQYLGLNPQKGYTGPSAGSATGSLMKPFDTTNLTQYPGYQFALQQGTQAIQNAASAGQLPGGYLSGATLKELLQFGQGNAAQYESLAFNQDMAQKQQQYNQLAGISGTGQTATAQTAGIGANTANQIAANQIGAGNARASSYVGGASAVGGAATGAVNAYANYNLLSNYLGLNSPSSGMSPQTIAANAATPWTSEQAAQYDTTVIPNYSQGG